ncbi:MAG TPA: cyclase family protein [Bryobacteraceae bacterium]|nr:cyclase family protein [Bryobacteraceae bacterium]
MTSGDGGRFSARERLRWMAGAAALATARDGAAASSDRYPRNLTQADIERWMTELSNWGRWGKEDQAGTVNLITPAKRKQAAALIKEGISVSMSLDADIPPKGSPEAEAPPTAATPDAAGRGNGRGNGPRYTWTHTMRSNGLNMRGPSGYAVDSISVSFHGNNTTHFDALSHFIYNGHIYNGFPASEITGWGAEKNDVMPFKDGLVTRGVLIDWPRFQNVPYMGDDEAIYAEDLDAWEKKTGVKIESGDCVLLRTGRWKRVAEKGPLNLNVAAPGLYASAGRWLKDRDIALLGSDVVQDVRPSRIDGVNQPIHQMFLVAVGTPLFDNCDLEAAAEQAARLKRSTFCMTVAPLRVPGATGSPFNPLAIF